MLNIPSIQGCCQNDGSITGTDKQLYWNRLYSSLTAGDYMMDFNVPAGPYTVTFNNGTSLPSGTQRYFWAQGVLVNTVDSTVAAGGQNLQWSLTQNVTVGSNNLLSFYNTGIGHQSNNSGDVSSISVVSLPGGFSPTAPTKLGLLLSAKKEGLTYAPVQ